MDKPHILLLWGESKGRRKIYRIVKATGVAVVEVDTLIEVDLTHTALVVFDYDSLKTRAGEELAGISNMSNPPSVLMLTAGGDESELGNLFSHKAMTNLFATNSAVVAKELIVTVQKIISNNVFGVEKYLTWGVFPRQEWITASDQKEPALERLVQYLDDLGVNSRLAALARGVADEFLMNAIYSAPVDANGNPKYQGNLADDIPVDLEEGEELFFRYACDGHHFGVSVEDRFGRLGREKVLAYLQRCFEAGDSQIEHKRGGAGLGLYQAFKSLNHLIINVATGKRTEMIGTMDISGSYKDFATRAKSLHLFFETPAALLLERMQNSEAVALARAGVQEAVARSLGSDVD